MEDKFKCPRCGFEQPETSVCSKCRINIPRYIEIQKQRRAVPGGYVRKPRPREDKQRGTGPSQERIQTPPKRNDQIRSDGKLPPEPPEIELRRDKNITERRLIGIGDLFEKTWDIFKRRIGTLIALYLLTIALVLVPVGIFILLAYLISLTLPGTTEPLMVAGGIIGGIAGIIAGCWGFGSFICAVTDENLNITDSLEKGGRKIWAFIWLFSLVGYIIPGGFLLFFIPGVLFMVWFAFAVFILANEDEKGMNAVLKSKEYVEGYWVDVFGRLFVIWLASVGVGIIPFLGSLLSIMFVPFEMIFIYLIYEDLRSIKGEVPYPSSAGEKFKWIGIATLGYIVVPIIIAMFMGAALMYSLSIFKGAMPY